VSDEEKAQLFNEYFINSRSVFTDSTMLLPNLEEVSIPSNTISEVFFSLEDIFNELRSLQASKTVSPDNIGPKILNNCTDSLFAPLYHLFSLSLKGVVPSDWKCHSVR